MFLIAWNYLTLAWTIWTKWPQQLLGNQEFLFVSLKTIVGFAMWIAALSSWKVNGRSAFFLMQHLHILGPFDCLLHPIAAYTFVTMLSPRRRNWISFRPWKLHETRFSSIWSDFQLFSLSLLYIILYTGYVGLYTVAVGYVTFSRYFH